MLGETLTLPHADGNIVLEKINQGNYGSEYLNRTSLGETRVRIRHSVRKAPTGTLAADRHNVEVIQTVYATETTDEIVRKTYIVMEQAPSDVDVKLVDALCDWLIATADANILSLLQWSS